MIRCFAGYHMCSVLCKSTFLTAKVVGGCLKVDSVRLSLSAVLPNSDNSVMTHNGCKDGKLSCMLYRVSSSVLTFHSGFRNRRGSTSTFSS